jgi:hypothetical protein
LHPFPSGLVESLMKRKTSQKRAQLQGAMNTWS